MPPDSYQVHLAAGGRTLTQRFEIAKDPRGRRRSHQALRELYQNLALRTAMELAKLDRCLAEDVPALNALCRDTSLAALVPRPRVAH